MASTHKSLRSGTANKRPTTSIADGQIALNTNTTSPGLFFKDSTGATIIKVGPVHVGTTAPNATPASGGSSGNSAGEVWLDTSLTPNGVKIWDGSAWVNATPSGSTTVQGLLELATNAETQTGSDTARAVTPAGLQSKLSDSTSTTSSTTIASSTAVKAAYDLAAAAVPLSGGIVTGNLEIGTTGSLSFEGATANGFETTIAVTDPTADRTITLPDTTGTIVTTGDTGTVTGTMIASGTVTSSNIVDATIVDGDISATAEIAVSKLADGAARQLLQTDAAGTGVEWTDNVDIPGTLDVTGAATFDGIASHPLGTVGAPTITFTGDTNTGIYSPAADTIGFVEGGTEVARIDSSGRLLVGTYSSTGNVRLDQKLSVVSASANAGGIRLTQYAAQNTTAPILDFRKSRGTTDGSFTSVVDGDTLGYIVWGGANGTDNESIAGLISCQVDGEVGTAGDTTDMPGRLVFSTTADGASSPTEAMRVNSFQEVLIGRITRTGYAAEKGIVLTGSGSGAFTRDGSSVLTVARLTNDGELVAFFQANVQEGSISVSGTTVSYNGAHLSRWSQIPGVDPHDKIDRPEILRGTVMSNLDEMCDWIDPESDDAQANEQLNKTKISDVEGDKNVAGIFQGWDDDDDTWVNDYYLAMTGDFVIRIAGGVTVERGELLMSAGDGTAKPQDDDIIRSKTIAKVTSTNVSCTYEDNSYCVPCVLMAC